LYLFGLGAHAIPQEYHIYAAKN